jgi:hypothetical protein
MPIVSSTHVVGHAQADGRRYVTERHTDHLGATHEVSYLATVNADYVAIRTARVPLVEATLAENEFLAILNAAIVSPTHQSKAQFMARLREEYRRRSQAELAQLAYWIIERLNSGQITDAELQAAFGLSSGQYTNYKARAVTLHDDWAVILSATSE